MNTKYWQTQGWAGDLVAFFSGTLITVSFAPYAYWPLGLIAAGVLAQLFTGLKPAKAVVRSAFFGLGMFLSGASWIHVSLSNFGNTTGPIAALLTIGFALILALVFAFPFYFYSRFLQSHRLGMLLGFPAIWVLGEWLRTWLFTGFPWLFIGYGHHSTWLSGWAPLIGVLGISFLGVFSATALFDSFNRLARSAIDVPTEQKSRYRLIAVSTIFTVGAVWLSGLLLQQVQWTQKRENPINVSLIQPNIAQEMKWNPAFADYIFESLMQQTEKHWGKDLIVWPEAAIPFLYHEADEYLQQLEQKLSTNETAFITGILYDDIEQQKYLNSIAGMGKASGIYFKQRLVPFGEYTPFEDQLSWLLNYFNFPMSIIHKGPKNQALLSAHDYTIATSICYEVVYPNLVADYAKDANLIVTISNDAWFGDSIGPIQHFEMARMRALENQKSVIRVANTGISGVINANGTINIMAGQFVKTDIMTHVNLYDGRTPFSYWKSWPVVLGCFFICFLFSAFSFQRPPKHV